MYSALIFTYAVRKIPRFVTQHCRAARRTGPKMLCALNYCIAMQEAAFADGKNILNDVNWLMALDFL